ncbi:MAG TPA: hypothetical protein VF137_11715 [Candidatus Dormibacteraeota bacterium]
MKTPVYLEVGSKRVFAMALDWPGWGRSAKDEERALAVLSAYAPRYEPVARAAGLEFSLDAFDVVEHVPGNATTDFGAPGVVPEIDRRPIFEDEAERQAKLLAACWSFFDDVVASAPASLAKGPRGGGRDRDKIVAHVRDAEEMYATKIGLRGKGAATRDAILARLREPGPAVAAGDKGWPTRYMARRSAWHVLDHAWEIEDRSSG